MCSYRAYVPSSAGSASRRAVICPDFVSVFILLNNVSVSQMLKASVPLSFSFLIRVIFIFRYRLYDGFGLLPVRVKIHHKLPRSKLFAGKMLLFLPINQGLSFAIPLCLLHFFVMSGSGSL